MKAYLVLGMAALLGAGGLAIGMAQTRRSDDTVTMVQLPLKLPAVGNLSAVRQWQFGRLTGVEQKAGSPDILLRIRTADGGERQIIGPSQPLVELARRSNWFNPVKNTPGRADYIERMIAFAVDDEQRLIAMISLEPIRRNRNRLRRS